MQPPPHFSQPDKLIADLAELGWSVWEGFLTPQEVRILACETRSLWRRGVFRPAGVGHGSALGVRPEIRSDQILWLDPTQVTRAQRRFLTKMEALRLALNRSLFLGLLDLEAHLAIYPPGAYYCRHLDRFQGVCHRVLSCIVYLNQNWEAADGGQLRLYLEEESSGEIIDILPAGGTLVVFLSDRFYHEVLPARRERLSIAGWFMMRR